MATGQKAASPVADAAAATQAEPAALAIDPSAVTPPDMPAATGSNVTIERGRTRDAVPISVPHVSADAAASAPAKAAAERELPPSRQTAATPPFASTWRPSRGPALASAIAARLRSPPIRERSVHGTKKANSTPAARTPPVPNVSVPVTHAASAPLRVRAPAR